jgi:Ca-activated chloride channel family protein
MAFGSFALPCAIVNSRSSLEAGMIEQFHFLRPGVLLLLVPLGGILWFLLKHRIDHASWRAIVDSSLMPFILTTGNNKRGHGLWWVLAGVALISVIALAGPTWEKLPQAVYRDQASLVIALDLSRSMDAADIKPSRLTRARHKIADILAKRQQGQTALIVYAADAFTVTPLTDDVETIQALLPGLESELMPAQGSRADRAFKLALELFENSGIAGGDFLLVTDGLSDLELSRVEGLLEHSPSFRLSILAVGTPEGGPIPLKQGGFLKDSDGAVVISNLQEANLKRVAASGGGVYASISNDDIDIDTLTYLMDSSQQQAAGQSEASAELWRELGPGLLLLVLPFAAYAFRRGLIWMLPLIIIGVPPDAQALDWQGLWKNQEQQAHEMFEQGEFDSAAKKFDSQAWRASSHYRAGDFESALNQWQQLDDAGALYNRGNALAQLGKYEAAIDAYDQLLSSHPTHDDARYNKQIIEDLLEQQQQQQSEQQQPGEQQQSGEEQQDQEQSGDQSGDQSGQQSQSNEMQNEQSPEQSEAQQNPEDGQSETESTEDSAQQSNDQQESMASLEEQMSEQATEQWLRKIPDDPGGLLRRKFLYQYRDRGGVDAEGKSW